MKKALFLLCVTICTMQLHAQEISQKLDTLVNAYVQLHEFNGTALVYRNGKVLFHKAYGYKDQQQHFLNDTNTIFRVASVTKPFTSTLILKLAEEGKLSLKDKLSKYYPGFPHGDSITIEHLLTHTSGLYNYTNDGEFMTNEITKHATEEKILSLFRDKPLDFEPGKGWSYSNSGYHLLGCIIEKVTKMSYFDALRVYIFQPLQMTRTGFRFTATGYQGNSDVVATDVDSSICYAAGAICSTTGDLLKFHQALQSGKILSLASQNKAYTTLTHNYGYGWIVDSSFGRRLLSHSGGINGFRSNFAQVTEDDICIVMLSNMEVNGLHKITQKALAILYDQPYNVPSKKNPVHLSEAILTKYVGAYEIEGIGVIIDMKIENGGLVAYPRNGPRSELAALDETHFYITNETDFYVNFQEDGSIMIDNGLGKLRRAARISGK